MRIAPWFLFLPLLAGPAIAAELQLDDASLPGKDRYERCLALGRQSAKRAYNAAIEWQNAGGGFGASHCAAIALVSMKRFSEAAQNLDTLGLNPASGKPSERAVLLDQAGNAWLLAGKYDSADASFTTALALTPSDADILTDRARARGLRKNWAGAESDLTAALARYPSRADLLVLRASARHALGHKADARADIDQALTLQPNYSEALLQRGVMKYEAGDVNGAKADWQIVLQSSPGTEAAATAQQHIDDVSQPAPQPVPKSGNQ
jgi:tetratricopeptide (TPR) repeat protein